MSHVVTIATQIRDLEALRAACRRLNIQEPTHETVRIIHLIRPSSSWGPPQTSRSAEAGQVPATDR